jgi:beta-1,4-N-acetylglucosaminyltransferase
MDPPSPSSAALALVVVAAASLLVRLVSVFRAVQSERRRRILGEDDSSLDDDGENIDDGTVNHRRRRKRAKTMVILGSGGHTSEMMRLLDELDPDRYGPVAYVVADTDATSLPRLEEHIAKDGGGRIDDRNPANSSLCEVHRLPRAREVHQSYVSSVLTTLHSFLSTLALLREVRPDLIIANGPGTCVPVIYASFFLRVLSFLLPGGGVGGGGASWTLRRCKLIFVESVCRVRTLSLSGRLAYPIVDLFVVHWPYLKERYPLARVSDVFVRHRDTPLTPTTRARGGVIETSISDVWGDP